MRMSVTRVSPQEAHDLVEKDGYVYIDVRSISEFDEGHPTGAYNIPIAHMTPAGMQPNARFVEEVNASFDKGAKIVLGCRSGGRSLRAAEILQQAGFSNVVDQRAGFEGAKDPFGRLLEPGWRSAGLAVATNAEPGRSHVELVEAKNED